MARRHVRREVEEKGWDHTKPHRIDETSIKLFKGASVAETQEQPVVPVIETVVEHVVEPVEQEESAVQSKPIIQESQELEADKNTKAINIPRRGKKTKELEPETQIKVDVPLVDE